LSGKEKGVRRESGKIGKVTQDPPPLDRQIKGLKEKKNRKKSPKGGPVKKPGLTDKMENIGKKSEKKIAGAFRTCPTRPKALVHRFKGLSKEKRRRGDLGTENWAMEGREYRSSKRRT